MMGGQAAPPPLEQAPCHARTRGRAPLPASSLLFQSDDRSLVLLDIPASLEEAQVLPGKAPHGRIYSNPPPAEPFPTPEPAMDVLSSWQPAQRIADLMTAARVRNQLKQLKSHHTGPFHLPRLAAPSLDAMPPSPTAPPLIPPHAHPLSGSIQGMRETFMETAPRFDLVVLDPPWPNRSVRRRTKGYATAYNLAEIRQLLTSIPISSHLAPQGLVAIWITNKPGLAELLTSSSGVFASWGVELVTEWTWVKITSLGDPLYDLDSAWRKPWERLLVAKARGVRSPPALSAKTLFSAPDVHSRKPNLRGLFQEVLGANYTGLEVFARNLTAGWWSWGDEVLHFQRSSFWRYTTAERGDGWEMASTASST